MTQKQAQIARIQQLQALLDKDKSEYNAEDEALVRQAIESNIAEARRGVSSDADTGDSRSNFIAVRLREVGWPHVVVRCEGQAVEATDFISGVEVAIEVSISRGYYEVRLNGKDRHRVALDFVGGIPSPGNAFANAALAECNRHQRRI